MAKTEQAITQGAFFDLMYANSRNPYFNTHRQYAFMRKFRNEVVLIVVNFDKNEQTVRVKIPTEAFQTLGFDDNKAAVQTDLLTGETCVSTLTTACPYQLVLPAYSGRILRFTYK